MLMEILVVKHARQHLAVEAVWYTMLFDGKVLNVFPRD